MRTCVGTDWKHGGRGPRYFDCIGLYMWGAAIAGVPVRGAPTSYPRRPVDNTLLVELQARLVEIPPQEREPGDLFAFWTRRDKLLGRLAGHVGVWSDPGIVHAWADAHKVIEWSSLPDKWERRIAGVFRLPAGGDAWLH